MKNGRLPRRRVFLWLQIGTAVFLAAAWFAVCQRRAVLQEQAVFQLVQSGVTVKYKSSSQPPEWLASIFGEHLFLSIEEVDFPIGGSEADIVHLARLPGLSILDLSGVLLSEDALSQVGQLQSVEILKLRATGISDDGLKVLARMENLIYVDLDHNPVSDEAVGELLKARSIEVMYLGDTFVTQRPSLVNPVTRHIEGYTAPTARHLEFAARLERLGASVHESSDGPSFLHKKTTVFLPLNFAGSTGDYELLLGLENVETLRIMALPGSGPIGYIGAMKDLKWLDIEGSLSDGDLKRLSGLSGLEELDIKCTQVTDEGISALASFKSLKSLDVSDTRVTDRSVEQLTRMESLSFLRIQGTLITESGADRLRFALPDCKIIWEENR